MEPQFCNKCDSQVKVIDFRKRGLFVLFIASPLVFLLVGVIAPGTIVPPVSLFFLLC